MRVLGTPDSRFEDVPGYQFAPHYVEICQDRGGLIGLRLVAAFLVRNRQVVR